MWLFLTTTCCLICGTLNAGGFFDLENEANPEVWMNIVSHHAKSQRTSRKAGLWPRESREEISDEGPDTPWVTLARL